MRTGPFRSALGRLGATLATRPFTVALLAALGAVLFVEFAEARPGGGHTYRGSGRSRSSGGGGSGGGGDGGDLFLLVYYLFRLVVAVPAIGVPVLIIVIIFVVLRAREGFQRQGWDVALPHAAWSAPQPSPALLDTLRRTDPDFSVVLFEDRIHALFSEVHTHRGGGRLARLSAYVTDTARSELARFPADTVTSVLVGSMHVADVSLSPSASGEVAWVHVTVDFEANYTERAGGKEQTYFVHERWSLRRSATARSKPPEKARVFECPSCGAPLDQVKGHTCSYCGKVVDTGEFDWVVVGAASLEREPRPPALAGDAPEVGTMEPTVVDPRSTSGWEALVRRDPSLDWPHFVARIELVFRELSTAWTAQDLRRARPFLSDGVVSAWAYWFDAYRTQGLRNVTDKAQVASVHLARVASDKYFDAVTVRLFASSQDYTLDAGGRIVSGSNSRVRDYSEYWTLVRGSSKSGAPKAELKCPSCGAALAVEMTGQCSYCRAKVTSGEFDWVVSRIEQDESYVG